MKCNPLKNRRILVIDDNHAIHEDFRKILAPSKLPNDLDEDEAALFGDTTVKFRTFEIDSAYQGEEGMDLIRKSLLEDYPYALAFVDVRMPPGWDGIQTTSNIWKKYPDLQVVICTAYSDYSWEEILRKLGYSDRLVILKKPFDAIEVLQLAVAMTEKWRFNQQTKLRLNELQATNQALEAANKGLEAFSYSVSHDLRAPVRHVAGYVKLLEQSDGQSLSEKGFQNLGAISSSAKRMGNLIDDLLDFSRIGQSEMQKAEVDLGELVREILGDFQEEIKERNIVWTIHPLPAVRADHALLRQVMVNLISNALKFGGTRTEAKIEIGAAPNGNAETVIFVRDNGVGFDPRYNEKLFGVFERLHSQGEFEGTGIGLAIVERIIRRHGGRAWAEGVVDRGATLYFSIPK